MIISWLRAIFRRGEDPGRIAFLLSRVNNLEYVQETQMARMDDLTAIVVEVGAAVDALTAHVTALSAVVAAGEDDPALINAVDTLRSIKGRIDALVPAPEPAPAG